VLLVTIATTIGCDQVSKHLASVHLMGVPRHSFLGDTMRLEYAENEGAFLSLGERWPRWARTAAFTAGTALILAGCALILIRRRASDTGRLGLALVVAGGTSNLFDRVARGAVIDFLNVGVGPLRTGIFNVADMAIMLGIALIVLERRRVAAANDSA
jgi:signal peptidase II